MNFTRIFVVLEKELAQMFGRWTTLLKICLIPLLLTAGLIWALWYANLLIAQSGGNSSATQTIDMVRSLIPIILLAIYPTGSLTIAATLSASSIVTEKNSRSLEPLLATPLTTGELLVGKMLAAVIPAILVLWFCYSFLVAGTHRMAVWSAALFNQTWVYAILFVAPLLTILTENFILMISARSAEVRKAQEGADNIVKGVMIAFIGGLLCAKFKLKWDITPLLMLKMAVVLGVLNVCFFLLLIRMFRRETIIGRWE